MPAQYEAFVMCQKTGQEVSTNFVLSRDHFAEGEKPYGTFNCPACKEAHFWSHENTKVHLVVR
jgi:hypothetical protein